MNIDYFYHTSANKWRIVDAIYYYDSRTSYGSFIDLLQVMKRDLISVGQTQKTMKKISDAKLEEVEILLNLAVHNNGTGQQNQNNVNDNIQNSNAASPVSAPNQQSGSISISETFNNNGQVNISTSTISTTDSNILGNKRNRENVDPRDLTGDTTSVRGPLTDFTNNPNAYTLSLNEGKNQYTLSTPSAEAESPHRPKLRKTQLASLEKLFHFGTSFSSNNPLTRNEYQESKQGQKKNASLKALNLFDLVVRLLEDVPYDAFNHDLWTSKPVCRTAPLFAQNHERTHFVENVIPSLLALAKITGFIEFKWCETPFLSSKCLNLQEYNYDHRSTPASKLIDALGILKTQNNMELVIVEASSGSIKENTTHTIEDSLKMLECGVSALRKELANYPNASLATFKKLKVFSLQIVKTQVTLGEMSLFDKYHWKFIEKRSAKLPTNWDDRIGFTEYLELLATLFDGILTVQEVQKQLLKENLGLFEYDGPSAESITQET